MAAKKPLFAFFGTPVFSVNVLSALEAHGLLPALVITAPDKPRGRGLVPSPSPAKAWALERGIEVMEPSSLRDAAFLAELGNTEWDVFVTAAYAKLVPQELLDMPRRGALNVHPSLLPKFRGPSPVVSAILADARETGITIMQMTEKMDAGPVVAQARVEFQESEWPLKGSELEELLATEGGTLLAETLPDWCAGKLPAEPQDESLVSYTKKFADGDALLDSIGDARQNLLKVRAFDTSPRAHYFTETKNGATIRVNVIDATIDDGIFKITRVIPEGKKEMSYDDFRRGMK